MQTRWIHLIGYWAVLFAVVLFPGWAGAQCPDMDGDTLCDAEDPCKSFPNTLPLQINNFFGIPDECFCGDHDGNHVLTGGDAQAINQCAGFARFDCDMDRDDVDGNGVLTGGDAKIVNNVAGFAEQAYRMVCPWRPEGTCSQASGVPCVCGDGVIEGDEDCDPPANTTDCILGGACQGDCSCPLSVR